MASIGPTRSPPLSAVVIGALLGSGACDTLPHPTGAVPTAAADETDGSRMLFRVWADEEGREVWKSFLRADLEKIDSGLRRDGSPALLARRDSLRREIARLDGTPSPEPALASASATAPRSTAADYVRIIRAETRVDVYAWSGQAYIASATETTTLARIKHEVNVTVAGRSFPTFSAASRIVHKFWTSQFPISGIDCRSKPEVAATTRHTATDLFGQAQAGSNDRATCDPSSAFECGNDPVYADDPATGGPYEPNPNEDPYTQCDGGGNDAGGSGCTQEYVYVEIFNEETGVWEVYWEGYATVCG